MISGGIMADKFTYGPAMFIGGLVGGALGVLGSPMFMFADRGDKLFGHLVICFVIALPVVILSALSSILPLAIALDLLAIFTTFHMLGKNRSEFLYRKKDLFLPAIIFGISGVAAYIYDDLPDDAPSLIEMLADNDTSRHIAAGRKLSKKFGKEPLLAGLRHPDARVRSGSAHFLSWFRDPFVVSELVKAANDPNERVRMWVAFSLGEIGNQQVLAVLSTLVSDNQEVVRRQAAESIEKIKKQK